MEGKPNGREDDDDDRKPPAKMLHMDDPPPETPSNASGGTSVGTFSTTGPITPFASLPPLRPRRLELETIEKKSPLLPWKQEIVLLSTTSAISLGVFLSSILPFTALVALATWFSSMVALLFALYAYSLDRFRHAVEHRGFGDYLPAWLYRTLAEQSFHEFMTDGTFVLENRHLLLYFLPGLSEEQLTAYIQRLAPHHREALMRPGLGHFLGDDFMRLVLGKERLPPPPPPRRPARNQRPAIEVIVEEPSRRLDVNDDDSSSHSDLGLDVSGGDLAGGLSDNQASGLMRSLGIAGAVDTPAVVVEEEDEDEEIDDSLEEMYAEEEIVINDAFWNSIYQGFWSPFYQWWTNYTWETLGPPTSRLLRYGMELSLVSVGIGFLGYRRGVYRLPRFDTRVDYPPTRTLWTSLVIGGTTTGVMLFARSMLRSWMAPPEPPKKKLKKKAS